MALANVTISKAQGGLGFPATNQDMISGLVIYDTALPSGWANGDVKTFYSVADAEAQNIKGDYSGATSGTGVMTVTAVGAVGDRVVIKLVKGTISITLCDYFVSSGDTTPTLLAASLVGVINQGSHGFTASNVAGAITYVVPKKYGTFFNTSTTTKTITGTVTFSADTAVTGGVADNNKQYHYQISEFFRMNPNGTLWVKWSTSTAYTFTEVSDLQNTAIGVIRQCGVITDRGTAYTSSHVTALQSIYNSLKAIDMPMELVFAPEWGSVTTATATDLSTFTANDVMVVAACDIAGTGGFIATTTAKSIPALGATLGTISLATVAECIGSVGQFNLSDGTELESVGIFNLINVSTQSVSALTTLENKRYTFLRKYIGRAGSYFNDDNTATSPTSDYSKIRLNRTIDKAVRLVKSAMLPFLNGKVLVNANGTLRTDLMDSYKAACENPLNQMLGNVEISDYQVSIDPNQNVITTSTINIVIRIIPVGAAKFINVTIGFTTKL
jgi:hypothetical protein